MAVDTPEPTRTYEIEFNDGSAVRVDIPEGWKVTFGPIIGGDGASTPKSGQYSAKVLAFRAWEAETKQRLLLTGVSSFRDISLPMLRRAVRKFGTETWMADDGRWTGQKSLEVQKSWVKVEDIDERPPEDEPEDPDEKRAKFVRSR